MLKIQAFVLASFILVSSLGLPLNIHYCKGKIAKVSLLTAEKCDEDSSSRSPFACCLKKKSCNQDGWSRKDCCSDETTLLNVDLELKPLTDFQPVHLTAEFTFSVQNEIEVFVNPSLALLPNINAPPEERLYLVHSRLLFYG